MNWLLLAALQEALRDGSQERFQALVLGYETIPEF